LTNEKDSFLKSRFGLQKWDGFKWHRAGLPRAASLPTTAAGTTYSRQVYVTLDFKGNETIGDFSFYANTPAAGNITFNPTKTGGATPSPSPQNDLALLDYGFDCKYIRATSNPSHNTGTKELTVPSTDHNLKVGNWIQFSPGSSEWTTNLVLANNLGYNKGYLVAMQVKSIAGSNVVFDTTSSNVYIWVDKSEWITAQRWQLVGATFVGGWENWSVAIAGGLNNPTNLSQFSYASNVWMLSFVSTSINSGYTLRGFRPIAYMAASYTFTVPSGGSTISMSTFPFSMYESSVVASVPYPALEDAFDDTVVRSVFPLSIKYLTTSAGFLVAADDSVVYYSSAAFGSSAEVIDGLSNFVPGTNRDGLIVGIGATENFVFLSREKRNYTVIGNIATGNFEVRAYRETQPGVTDYKNIISLQDNVLFANKFGIFAANQSSQVPLSGGIVGLFYKATTQRQAIDGAPLGPLELGEASYDYTRNWVSWRYTVDSSAYLLILDLNNGEYYRWSWLTGTCQFVNGMYYIAVPGATASLKVEDISGLTFGGNPIDSWITTSWIHLEEPSLEKQFTQVKLFVRDVSSAGNIVVSAYQDWQSTTALQSNVPFEIDPAYPLSQKHKFASNKSLAISLVFKAVAGERMEIEGYELEYNPIQEGMKR